MPTIEGLLAQIHKQIAQSGFAVAQMLARRKLRLAVLEGALEQLKITCHEFDKIVEQLKQESKR